MIVLDASAAIKLVMGEPDSDFARKRFGEITASGEPILAPDLMLSEAASGLWKHLTLLHDISDAQFNIALNDLLVIWDSLIVIKANEVMVSAANIAKSNKITIYDALYVTISRSKDAPLFTFDRPIIEKSVALGIDLVKE